MADPSKTATPWQPTQFEGLVDGPFKTSMGTAKVKTNATYGYLKALGNSEGPHALACEFVGTSLAQWFGLSVADFATLRLEEVDCYDLPAKDATGKGPRTQPGPAFISKAVPGKTWADDEDLPRLENPKDITRLVVFDNWVRNCDRHPPDLKAWKPNYANVYLAKTKSAKKFRLYAIDHTHCFDRTPDLSKRLAEIDRVKDNGVYGLFPEFVPFIDAGELAWCKAMLQSLEKSKVQEIVAAIPPEWEVEKEAREALVELIVRRASYLVGKLDNGWGLTWWQPPAE